MTTNLHPQARRVLASLHLPRPLLERTPLAPGWVDLANSVNPFAESYRRYPDVGHEELRAGVLRFMWEDAQRKQRGKKRRLPVPTPDHLIFTNGAVEGIDLLVRTFGEPGRDRVVVTSPTFGAFAHWSRIHGLEVVDVPLRRRNFDRLDVEGIRAAKAKLIFLCDPNNPVGTRLPASQILRLVRSTDALVVVDEAYVEFSELPSAITQIPSYRNLVVIRTLSKAWGLAGARCGVVVAHPDVVRALEYVQIPFTFSTPGQEIVSNRLRRVSDVTRWANAIRSERRRVEAALEKSPAVTHVFTSDASFLLVQFRDSARALAALRAARLAVVDFGGLVERTVRISIGAPKANDRLIAAVSTLVDGADR